MKVTAPGDDHGVYGISTAAELTGVAVQTLRLYESHGLVEPTRTDGGTRRYSVNDLELVRRIGALSDAGVNLSTVALVLGLQNENARLRAEKEEHRWMSAKPTKQRASVSPPSGTQARRGRPPTQGTAPPSTPGG